MNIMNTTDYYRLGALAELAHHYPAPITARQVSETRRIPFPYLAQLVRDLSQRGLVNTRRGPGGGLTLAQPAGEISLSRVLDATIEISGCPPQWLLLFESIESALGKAIDQYSVADLALWEHKLPAEPEYNI
ncbi:MAG: hypothetical protein GY906_28630 [bacterium]|nr:hypothetical protein [bacterium]